MAILCFFPVMVNTLRGLTSVNPRALELMQSYAAGQVQIFRRVRIPTALPFIFTGLKVATVLAMIGAVVGEYFGGALNALGVQILTRAVVAQFQRGLGGILMACLLGFALYLAVVALERLTPALDSIDIRVRNGQNRAEDNEDGRGVDEAP